jgi:hypothetical protein
MGSGAVAGAAGNAFVDTPQKKKRSKKNDWFKIFKRSNKTFIKRRWE